MIINNDPNSNQDQQPSKFQWVTPFKWIYKTIVHNSFLKIKRETEERGMQVSQENMEKLITPESSNSKSQYLIPEWLPKFFMPTHWTKKVDFSKTKEGLRLSPVTQREQQVQLQGIQPPPPPNPNSQTNSLGQKAITKVEYMYGIKHLEINHKQYENRAVFVSKPMEVEGNVMQVSLHAIEDHPLFDSLSGKATDRKTSVEYYIAYVENPSLTDWHPILPEDVKTVKCELLMFNTARTADLRFPALIGANAAMYKNGLVMTSDEWSFVDGGTRVQLLSDYDPTSIYTIDYTPNAEIYNPWVIDIRQQGARRVKQIDVFPNGTNHNKTVILTKYPYVDYERIYQTENYDPNTDSYRPIIVRLKNASIVGPNRVIYKEVLPYDGTGEQPVYTKNVTNYKTGEWKELRPYSIVSGNAYNAFEYWHEGNKLYFSETFNKADIYENQELNHGNAEIEVEYETLVSNFRLKIILRRNSIEEYTVTPVVHEYALKFRVMR